MRQRNLAIKTFDERGVASILIIIAIAVVVAGAGLLIARAKHNDTVSVSPSPSVMSSPSASPTPHSSRDGKLVVGQWGVVLNLDSNLDVNYAITTRANTSVARIAAPDLTGQPSICTGESTTNGAIGNLARSTTKPVGMTGESLPADQVKQIGTYYYTLGLPNGSSCQKSTELQQREASYQAALQKAFQTLTAE